MSDSGFIKGFSGLTSTQKAELISKLTAKSKEFLISLEKHKHPDAEFRKRYQEFSENNLSDFHLPFGIAPNFLVNNKFYHVPMVIEESSVVAAAASAAKFWAERGGFRCNVRATMKNGHVHFLWVGDPMRLEKLFGLVKKEMQTALNPMTESMMKRGGGIRDIKLIQKSEILKNYYQLEVSFETVDSMGANFINTCLELLAADWKRYIETFNGFKGKERGCEIIMAILSNYTPDCLVDCRVSCPVSKLEDKRNKLSGKEFAAKFIKAVHIAREDMNRAVTHNKGIFNGIDAVAMATGNDYRAVEANGHAYAARGGKYQSLSRAWLEDDQFNFQLQIPLAIGTVGGLTQSHPLAAYALEILGNPDAKELMQITAAAGLANNFSAVRSLITTGIQKGHMKLHLSNILEQLSATREQKAEAMQYFIDKTVSFSSVKEFLER